MLSKLLGLAFVFVSSTAFAQRTVQLGSPVYLNDCGGAITLNQAYNGDLSIQLIGVDTYRCPNLQVSDATSGRIIRSYYIQGTSYTLSRDMLASLGSDCRLNFNIGGSFWSNDGFVVYIPWCTPSGWGQPYPTYPPVYPVDPYPRYPRVPNYPRNGYVTYEWSRAGNCKMMIDGQYSGQNVDDSYCGGSWGRGGGNRGGGRGRVTYEWSNAGNCKMMIDGVYSGQNVSRSFCR